MAPPSCLLLFLVSHRFICPVYIRIMMAAASSRLLTSTSLLMLGVLLIIAGCIILLLIHMEIVARSVWNAGFAFFGLSLGVQSVIKSREKP